MFSINSLMFGLWACEVSDVVSHDLGAWATASVWPKLLLTVGLSTEVGAT